MRSSSRPSTTGCAAREACSTLRVALRERFPDASVHSACRELAGNEAGFGKRIAANMRAKSMPYPPADLVD
jgi:hypothetical protein